MQRDAPQPADGKKISQRALREVPGVNERNIRFYKAGGHCPGLEGVLILADYFQVPLDDLVGRREERKEP